MKFYIIYFLQTIKDRYTDASYEKQHVHNYTHVLREIELNDLIDKFAKLKAGKMPGPGLLGNSGNLFIYYAKKAALRIYTIQCT